MHSSSIHSGMRWVLSETFTPHLERHWCKFLLTLKHRSVVFCYIWGWGLGTSFFSAILSSCICLFWPELDARGEGGIAAIRRADLPIHFLLFSRHPVTDTSRQASCDTKNCTKLHWSCKWHPRVDIESNLTPLSFACITGHLGIEEEEEEKQGCCS